jgi:hypothetical protein
MLTSMFVKPQKQYECLPLLHSPPSDF